MPIDKEAEKWIRKAAERKPLLIDEADGSVNAFKKALAVGYSGTSHKNCKGVFKSLLNHALAVHRSFKGQAAFLSGEDLQNLPVVPLHQDFTTLGILGLTHCERNGHHYLPPKEPFVPLIPATEPQSSLCPIGSVPLRLW